MFQVLQFFYGVLKVGLNTQQKSPATHCSAIQNSTTSDLGDAEFGVPGRVNPGADAGNSLPRIPPDA